MYVGGGNTSGKNFEDFLQSVFLGSKYLLEGAQRRFAVQFVHCKPWKLKVASVVP